VVAARIPGSVTRGDRCVGVPEPAWQTIEVRPGDKGRWVQNG